MAVWCLCGSTFFLTHWRFDVFQCPLAQLEVGGIQRCLSIAVGPKIRCCQCPKLQMMLGCWCSCFGWVFWWTRHTSPWDIVLDFCCSIFPTRIPSRSFSHSAIVVVFFRLWDTSPNRWVVFFSNRPEIYLEAYWVATVVVVYSRGEVSGRYVYLYKYLYFVYREICTDR